MLTGSCLRRLVRLTITPACYIVATVRTLRRIEWDNDGYFVGLRDS